MRQGMRPGHNHPSSIYASWSRLTNSCFDGKNEYPTFSWLGHVKYAPGVCATVRPLRAEPKAPMDCLGQSSFETGYAPGMRQPHSPLVILFQLEHGGDSTTGFAAERQVCDDCFHQSEAVPQVCGLNLDMSRRLFH